MAEMFIAMAVVGVAVWTNSALICRYSKEVDE